MIKLFCIEIEVGLARPLSSFSLDPPSPYFFGLLCPVFHDLAVKFNLVPVLDGEPYLLILLGDPLASILIVFLFAPGEF